MCPQIQLRDLPGFVEARHQLLLLRPQNRANWINFAVAHHLNGNHELAAQVREPSDCTPACALRTLPVPRVCTLAPGLEGIP